MASNQDRSTTDNKASIALLRHLRAGGDDVHFLHRVDVCAVPPEVLVADLEPVLGTGLEDDGYSRIWYFYHAKKYKNTRGDTSGHRQRAVTGGDGTGWHSEKGRKDVQGSGGSTFCTLSYGRKTEPSARSIDRMGWCMVEYDFVAADSSNYVLCKVYRSPRAKGKSALASSSSKNASSGGGEHPEAPPAKSIQRQEQVQQETAYYPMPNYQYQAQADVQVAVQQPAGPGGDFNFNIEEINLYVDDECGMLRADESEQGRRGLQQPISDVEFIRLPCGPVVPVWWPKPPLKICSARRRRRSMYSDCSGGMSKAASSSGYRAVRWCPWWRKPCSRICSGSGGEWSGGMATARIPWSSSYAPSYTACSGLLQGPDPLLQLPYLMC